VLALVSKPGFDPNLFVDGIDPVNWDALNNSPDKPLNNRALRGQYPPGSTIKPFMALAALEYKKRAPEFAISDPGYFTLAGVAHRYRDWKKEGHGMVNMHKSIVISCDTYYYGLAVELGIDSIHSFPHALRLRRADRHRHRRRAAGHRAEPGMEVEPLQAEVVHRRHRERRHRPGLHARDPAAAGGRRGDHRQRRVAGASAAPQGRAGREDPGAARGAVAQRRGAGPEARELKLVTAAMVDVTRPGGTAARASQGATYAIAAKTGTAQVIGMKQGEKYDEKRVKEQFRDHALFIAYAPADDPKLAMAILVENGGHGGDTAAPIARQVFDYHLLRKVAAEKPKLEPRDDEEHD
jgi:penicillin-binding protein 2